jgi:hypothetical protein
LIEGIALWYIDSLYSECVQFDLVPAIITGSISQIYRDIGTMRMRTTRYEPHVLRKGRKAQYAIVGMKAGKRFPRNKTNTS